jgi:hypothetical protein
VHTHAVAGTLDETDVAVRVWTDTSNASQGRLRGATDARLAIEGTDDKYLRAARLGRLAVPFDEKGWPVKQRVGRHTLSVMAVFAAFSTKNPDKSIALCGLPGYVELTAKGLEAYLQAAPSLALMLSDARAANPAQFIFVWSVCLDIHESSPEGAEQSVPPLQGLSLALCPFPGLAPWASLPDPFRVPIRLLH